MPAHTPRTPAAVAAVAAVVVALVWVFVVADDADSSSPLLETVGWLLTVAGCAALYWRRRRPVGVAVFVTAAAGVYFPLSGEDVPLLVLAFAVALYTVAAEGRLLAASAIALVTLLSVVYGELGLSAGRRHVDDTALFLLAGWFVGLVAAGYAQHTRQAYLREAEERALAAEREKDVRARQSAAEERLRIARELHDVLGHSVSLISVQAGAVLHRFAKDPSRTEELVGAMESVRDTSREALRELRAALGVLRQPDGPVPPAEAGPGGLAELGARARRAGVDVEVDVDVSRSLPPQVSTAAYRIVQESLTNVVRHARARRAWVRVWVEGDERVEGFEGGEGDEEFEGHGADEGAAVMDGPGGGGRTAVLRVRVADDGRGASRAGAGVAAAPGSSGITGMRERARALGGELTVRNAAPDEAVRGGDGSGPGFVVEASLPLPGSAEVER